MLIHIHTISAEEIFDMLWNDHKFAGNFSFAWKEYDKCNPLIGRESKENAEKRLKVLIKNLFEKKHQEGNK